MNDITLLREVGPDAAPLPREVRSSARAALLAEIGAVGIPARRRLWLPSRTAGVRITAGVAVAAVAWTAAVVIAGPDPTGTPASGVTLVDFEMPTFPLSLDPVPEGLRAAFDGDADGSSVADYRDAAGENGFTIYVSDEAPDPGDVQGREVTDVADVDVGRRNAELVTGREDYCDVDDQGLASHCRTRPFAVLVTEWREDLWVSLSGQGRYTEADRLLHVADSLIDRPQPATLRVGLAPAGWSVQFFKMGRVLTLVDDADEQQTLTVQIPQPADVVPPGELLDQLMSPVGPLVPVTVHGRPAHLVLLDSGYLDQRIWFLQAQFADGTTFELQAPEAFSQEQVLEMAEQVTYTP
jgi:hypothetical protein